MDMIIVTFLNAVTNVDVLTANNKNVNLVETRTEHFDILKDYNSTTDYNRSHLDNVDQWDYRKISILFYESWL